MFYGEASDFVSFSLLGFTLVIQVRNFDFESFFFMPNINTFTMDVILIIKIN